MKIEDRSSIDEAVRILKKGGVIIFPTDTVWGIGVSVASKEGISKLYKIKKRKRGKPTAVLVSDMGMAGKLGEFSKEAINLAKKHWPGGLTIIVKAEKRFVPSSILGEGGSIGLRVPDNKLVLEILKKFGTGIVAGSANISGGVAPRYFGEIDKKLLDKVDYVVSGESWDSGSEKPSTVVDTSKKPFVVLRKGSAEVG